MDPVQSHFGNWFGVGLWIIMYGVMLAFMPFYQKSKVKPASAYLAFVLAFALEMFGVPFSMYFLTWVLGSAMPDGILWGHTLNAYIGLWGMYIAIFLTAVAFALVFTGWREIYRKYWSKESGKGQMVTTGIYHTIRHPQYTGFLLITLAMMCEWATLALLLMWPVLVLIYVRLARKEEADMEAEFGQPYRDYKARTGMFLPKLSGAKLQTA